MDTEQKFRPIEPVDCGSSELFICRTIPIGEEQEKMETLLSNHTSVNQNYPYYGKISQTFPEAEFDDLAHLAAEICQMPIVAISLLEDNQHSINLTIGLKASEAQHSLIFCDYALQHSDVTIVEDTLADQQFATHPIVANSPYIRFYAGVPLVSSEGVTLGTLGVMDYMPGDLSWKQKQALKILSRQVVVQLELGCQLNYQNEHLCYQTKMPLEKFFDIADIFESLTDAFFALDDGWQFTYLNSRAEQILLKTKEELIGRVLWDGLPDIVGSTFDQELYRALSKQVTVHFEEFYPLLGIWLEVRAYPYLGGLLVYLRDVTARKQSESMAMQRSHQWNLAAEIGIALTHGGAIAELLNHCAEIIVKHLDAGHAGIWTVNQESGEMEIQAAFSSSCRSETGDRKPYLADRQPPDVSACHLIGLDNSIVNWIGQTRQPYLLNDLRQAPSPIKAWLQQTKSDCSIPIQAFTGYPLIVEDRLIGVMVLSGRQSFTPDCHQMLEWVANAIAVAIDRAWARAELKSRWESLLFRLASQIRNSLDLDMILATAVNEIRTLLQIDRCHFVWCWPHLEQPSLTVTHEACVSGLSSMVGDYPSAQISSLVQNILDLKTLRIDHLHTASHIDRQTKILLSDLSITSQLLIPLKTHSGQLGAIVCSHSSGSRPWSDGEVELLQAVVDQLAIAIDQAELYAQTRAAAFAAQTQAQQLSNALNHLKQTEAHLVHTEKMSSLGQMVAGIAHEINNPVNFIYGNLDYAKDYIQDLLRLIQLYQKHYPNPVSEIQQEIDNIDVEFLKEDLAKILASMQVGTERIRQIVLSLRNFSRLDEAEKKPVNIHDGIDSTLLILYNRIKGTAKRPEIQVIKEYGELPLIECYAGQLNQVFMNIVSNAIDALDDRPEPRIISIRTEFIRDHLVVADGKEVPFLKNEQQITGKTIVRIADNGSGMTPEVQKRLFDPFFTTKPVGKGTGLGLSISYQIVVDKHGGRLQCCSTPGQGSEFVIEIPVQTWST